MPLILRVFVYFIVKSFINEAFLAPFLFKHLYNVYYVVTFVYTI